MLVRRVLSPTINKTYRQNPSDKPWVISHVPMFHITQPLDSMIGINGLLDGYFFR